MTQDKWLQWAARLMPAGRDEWLSAMRAEMASISEVRVRQSFARGCFRSALGEWARSRRALSLMARLAGALALLMMSIGGMIMAQNIAARGEDSLMVFARILPLFCLIYALGALLLLTSLRAVRIYAALGFGLALTAFAYVQISAPVIEGLSPRVLTAFSLEVAGLMGALFLASLYLNWLYDPDGCEV